jgi:transcriptional/translational regulatory protein YebC/TACO1
VRKATDKRWCEDVTLALRNTGGSAVRSGSVTFGTHVIGALGIDWATLESTAALPAPIEAGAREERTWTVCVDAWRVPIGMRVETRDVSVQWR